MSLFRHYSMTAQQGLEHELRQALLDLVAKVRPVAGCEGIELYQESDKPSHYILIEQWQSVEAHRAGGQVLGRDAFSRVMATLSSPPIAASLQSLT